MKFALKYWWIVYKEKFKPKQIGKAVAFYSVASLIIVLLNLIIKGGFTLPLFIVSFIKILLLGLVFYYGYLAVKTTTRVRGNYKYLKLFNDKGYCTETFDCFYQTYIKDRVMWEANYVELAEHYRRLGDYDSAIDTLNSIHVSESNIFLRAKYIYTLMIIAVNRNDTSLVDSIRSDNQDFINSRISSKNSGEGVNLIYLAMIYGDCAVGRYEQALCACNDVLESEQLKKCNLHIEKFLVMKVFLLKKLEKEAEMNAAIMEFNNYVSKKWKPLFESSRTYIRLNFEKAVKGEIPV